MKWWLFALLAVIGFGTTPTAWRWLAPTTAWILDRGGDSAARACERPWRTWAALYRGSADARSAYPCASHVTAGRRGDSLRHRLADAGAPPSHRREWARLLLVAGPAEEVLASASLPVDVRRGLVDEATVAFAQDDLLALSVRYPLGGVLDDTLVLEALSVGSRAPAEPVLAEAPAHAATRPLFALAARLPRGEPPVAPPAHPGATVLAGYGPVGEAFAEHVFTEWAAIRAWVAGGDEPRERASRAAAVLVGEAPGEPWMSVHALLRGERVVPVLVGLAAIDLGVAAALPVRVRGDADGVVVAVGHLAVYAPRCGPRRAVALPGTRPSPEDWGEAPGAQLGRAATLADVWGEPCAEAGP